MKKIIFFIVLALMFFSCARSHDPKTGDIIFQASHSAQSKAIELATHSKYSHVGIIVIKAGKFFVFHAVNPVRFTPLGDWIKDGEGGHYIIKRPKKTIGSADQAALDAVIKEMKGKPYDKYFGWGDDKIYCSELVWKVYKRVKNYELCGLRKMKDFDLTSPVVKKLMKQRYGNKVPLDEPVVSPGDIFESKELALVEEK